ncbi:hydrolase/acyltransferase [Paenibacillus koleovorans]|uniref:hydrolase/acyltransferase n=1 Tax=Paenibacillus koleovorans TaxID=121608 RepID=UPI000FDA4555|nr:hydrolase/acyltransferase [Paenibacillus koleovorans]
MAKMKYALLQQNDRVDFVEMPATHVYQLTALNRRLHKELDKLTAGNVPNLGHILAECEQVEVVAGQCTILHGLHYLNELEHTFASVEEKSYPLISLLTEIRALQAQLEQWYEEDEEGLH